MYKCIKNNDSLFKIKQFKYENTMLFYFVTTTILTKTTFIIGFSWSFTNVLIK